MPTVPYNPVPSMAVDSSPIPYRTDRGVSEAAFGANVGASMARFGDQIEKTSDVMEQNILKTQEIYNTTAAKDADVNVAMKIGQKTNEFYSLEGKNAGAAYPQYQKDIQQIREDGLQGLNPAARRMADVSIARRTEFALIDAGRHTAQQDKVYANQTSTNRVAIAQADAGEDPYNERRFQMNSNAIRGEIQAQGQQGGWPQERIQHETDMHISKAWQQRVQSIAQRDPFTAKAFYDAHMEEIKDPVIRNSIEQTLLRQFNAVGTRIRADQITQGGTYADRVAQRESAGDPFAKAKTSSALGLYQFTDETWNNLRARHPELQLDPAGRTDPGQARKAFEVFTAENRDALSAAGIDPNDKNAYMAHFLGAGGATKFIKAMQSDPNMPAASAATPAAVAANRSVFYSPDGRAKSVQEVYNQLTAKFGGPTEPLSGTSSGDWLNNAMKQADAMAQHDAPDDAEYKQMLEDRVLQRYNKAHQAQRLTDQGNRDTLLSAINGGGDPAKYMKSIDDVMQNPQLNEIYQHLPPQMQMQITNRIMANSKPDVHMTPERIKTYQQVMGLALTDPAKFLSVDSSKLDLPWAQMDRIFSKQMSMNGKTLDTTNISKVVNDPLVKGVFRSVGFPPDKADEGGNDRYNQLLGALDENLREYATKNKTQMPPEEFRKEVGRLVAEQSHSWFTGSTRAFQVPDDFKQEWRERLSKGYGGREPNEQEWGSFRQFILKRNAERATTAAAAGQ